MRYSSLLIPTLKEDPREAEVISHKLLVRGGYIRKVAAGIYDYLPLALRTIRKIEALVREEMNRAGCQEILMPIVQPSQLWEDSGRWEKFGPEFLRFKDRKGAWFGLGPTHEEVVTDIARREIKSYRQMPKNLYQIQTKFRDEVRPRAGLMRGREFIMKDGYSFDANEEGARRSYKLMYDAYSAIFKRCGLQFRPVEAATGAMGGNMSHEFQVLAESGEDLIVACDRCDYAANVEQAELKLEPATPSTSHAASSAPAPIKEVETPEQRTIKEVSEFLKMPPESFIKTLVYLANDKPVLVLVRGDHEVNEIKLTALLKAETLVLASDQTVEEVTGAPVGFAGPVNAKTTIVADWAVQGLTNGVTGANKNNYHLVNVNPGRDFTAQITGDIRQAKAGDICPRCGGTYHEYRGIEVGQVFFLGTRYSAPMGATFLDEAGDEKPMIMGCYGIGITRVMAAAIEQNHDDFGIIWPMAIAPYQVIITLPSINDQETVAVAEDLYAQLQQAGVEVIMDDRDERAGVKFKDADLIGIPIRVAVGSRSLKNGNVELKLRSQKESMEVAIKEATDRVLSLIKEQMA